MNTGVSVAYDEAGTGGRGIGRREVASQTECSRSFFRPNVRAIFHCSNGLGLGHPAWETLTKGEQRRQRPLDAPALPEGVAMSALPHPGGSEDFESEYPDQFPSQEEKAR